MTYSEFAKQTPILYGQINVCEKSKIGQFRPEWNRYTNSLHYQYYSFSGNKGEGGFTLIKAFKLFEGNRLSIDPENGNPKNYL